MSSPGSPTISLDISARRAELAVVVFAIAAAVFGLSFSNESIVKVATAVACLLTSLSGLFYMVGWLWGPRRLTRIVWQSDGRWMLCEANGVTYECELSETSRVTTYAAWLQWIGRGTRPLLLVAGDVSKTEFRRLIVRLRLDAHEARREQIDVS